MVAEGIRFIIPKNLNTVVPKDTWYSGKRCWFDPATYSKSVSSIPDEGW